MELFPPFHPPSLPHSTARPSPQPLLCRGHSHLSSRAALSPSLPQHAMQTSRSLVQISALNCLSAEVPTSPQLASVWHLSPHKCVSYSSKLGSRTGSSGCSSSASLPATRTFRCKQACPPARSSCIHPRNVAVRSSSPRLRPGLFPTNLSHPAQGPQQREQTESWVPAEHSITQNFLWGPQLPSNPGPSRGPPHSTYLADLGLATGGTAVSFTSLFRPTSPGSTAAEVEAFQAQNNPPFAPQNAIYPDSSVVSSADAVQFKASTSLAPLTNRPNKIGHGRSSSSSAVSSSESLPVPSIAASRSNGRGKMAAEAADFATTRRIQRCTNWYELRALLTVIGPVSLNHVHVAAMLSMLVRSITYTIGSAERIEFDRFVTQSLLGTRNAISQMTPVEISISIHALGKLGVSLTSSPQLLALFLNVAHWQLHEFTGKELSWLVWGLGRTCSGRVNADIKSVDADAAGTGARYGTDAAYFPEVFLQTLSDELVARFSGMNTQDLANVAVGLTLLLPPASALHSTQHPSPSLAETDLHISSIPHQPSSSDSVSDDNGQARDSSSSSSHLNGSGSDLNGSSSQLDGTPNNDDGTHSTSRQSPAQSSVSDAHDRSAFQLSFWHAFAGTSEQSLTRCTPQALSNIIHALAHAAYPNSRPWVQQFQTVTHRQLPSCSAQSLATMLGAINRLGVTPVPDWWEEFLAAASEPALLQAANPQDLAQLSMAVASTVLAAPSPLHRPPHSTPPATPHQDSPHMLNTASNRHISPQQHPGVSHPSSSTNASAAHHSSNGSSNSHSSSSSSSSSHPTAAAHDYVSSIPPFLAALDQCIENRAHNLPPSALSTCLASMARLSHVPPPDTLHAWLASAGKQLPLFSPCHIAHTFWALATLRLAPPVKWMSSAVAISKQGLTTASPRELALTIWSFHRLEYLPSWQWLLEWGKSTALLLREMHPRDLAMVLHSASMLRWKPPAAWLAMATEAAVTAVCVPPRRDRALMPSNDDTVAGARGDASAAVSGQQVLSILCGLHRLRSTPQLSQLQAVSTTVLSQLPSYSLRHASAVAAVLAEWLQPPRLHRPVSEQYSCSRDGEAVRDFSTSTHPRHLRRHRRRIRLALPVSLRRGSGPNSDAGSGFPAAPQRKLHPLASLLQPAVRFGSTQTLLVGLTGFRSRAAIPALPAPPPRAGLFGKETASDQLTALQSEAVAERARGTMSALEAGLRVLSVQKQQLGSKLLVQLLATTLLKLRSLAHQRASSRDTDAAQLSTALLLQHDLATSPEQADLTPAALEADVHSDPAAADQLLSGSDALSLIRVLHTVCKLRSVKSTETAAGARVLRQLLSTTSLYKIPAHARHPARTTQQEWLGLLYSVIDLQVMYRLPTNALLMLARGVRTAARCQPPPSTWVNALVLSAVRACTAISHTDESFEARQHQESLDSLSKGSSSYSSWDGDEEQRHNKSKDALDSNSTSSSNSSSSSRRSKSIRPVASTPTLTVCDQVALLYSVALVVAQQPSDQQKRRHCDLGKQLALKVLHNAMSASDIPMHGRAAKVHAAAMARRFHLTNIPHPRAHTVQLYTQAPADHTLSISAQSLTAETSKPSTDMLGTTVSRKTWKRTLWYQHKRWLRLHREGSVGAAAAGRVGMEGANLTPTQVGHLATAVALLLGPGHLSLMGLAPQQDKGYSWLLRRLQLAAPRMLPRQRVLLPPDLMRAIRELKSLSGPKTFSA